MCVFQGFAQTSSGLLNVADFGATRDGKALCTTAIAKAIEAASARGGGTVFFPAGEYLTGAIRLKSNITLYLDAGAVVKFSTHPEDYLPMEPCRWEGLELTNFCPLIFANGADHIAIVGRGILDGQGQPWWQIARSRAADPALDPWRAEFKRVNASLIIPDDHTVIKGGFLRPPFFQPYHCHDVLVEGVTFTNSPFWTVTPLYCEDVNIRGVTITNPSNSPNTDGINPDSCRNVHISDCFISVGDDCITIKSGRDEDGRRVGLPAENYTISNCTMERGHGGVSIGSEMSGGVRNITINNCVFNGTDNGIRIKSARGRGGIVEDIHVSNIVMRNITADAIILTLFYQRSSPEPVSERTPIFRNMHFSGITGDAKAAGQILGIEEMPIDGITFTDIQLKSSAGFTIKDARHIAFHNVQIDTDRGPALAVTNTAGLELDGFTTVNPHADAPVIGLVRVKDALLRNSQAEEGTETFVRADKTSAAELTLDGNRLSKAKTPLSTIETP